MKKLNFEDMEIKKNKKLGSGYKSEVYLAIHKKTKKNYAIKIVI